MKKILTSEAPVPAGHYSQAIIHHGLVFVAGQLPIDPETGKLVEGGIEQQVRRTIQNVKSILVAANSDLDLVLKATIYIPDASLWPEVNRVYAEVFEDHKPARAVIPCGELHYGALLEMEVIAATVYADNL
jgi:2-iminobutanoate/2-iminopropanoate deaminase